MRMLPATANAMARNVYSSLVSSQAPTSLTSTTNTILFYIGAVPTKADLDTLIGQGTQLTGGNAAYIRAGLLTTARAADYVGGATGYKATMVTNANNVPVALGAATNMKAVATFTDYRSCYFSKDATPTWCLVLGSATSNAINLVTGVTDAACAFFALCTVGDENSNADLKLVGGKVYSNSANQNDQAKAVIINDLVLKFA